MSMTMTSHDSTKVFCMFPIDVTDKKTEPAMHLFNDASQAEDRGDFETAVILYTQSARMGLTASQINLGNLFDDVLKPKDTKRALYWYKQAVKSGDEAGAWCLAMHYRNLGKYRWYLFWLRRAAFMGEEDAISEVKKLENLRPGEHTL